MPLYHVTEFDGLMDCPIELDLPPSGMGRPSESGIAGFYLSEVPNYYINRAAIADKARIYTVSVSQSANWLPDTYPAPDWMLSGLRDRILGKEGAIEAFAEEVEEYSTKMSNEVEVSLVNYLTTYNVISSDLKSLLSDSLEDYPGDVLADLEAIEKKVDWLRTDRHDPMDIRSLVKMSQGCPDISSSFLSDLLARQRIAGIKWDYDNHTIYCALSNDETLIKVTDVQRPAGAEPDYELETQLRPEVMDAENRLKLARAKGEMVLFHSTPRSDEGLRSIKAKGLLPGMSSRNERPGDQAIFLSQDPEWMGAVAAKGSGKDPSTKLTTDELCQEAAICICFVDSEKTKIYQPEFDDTGCLTGGSTASILDCMGTISPGDPIDWMPDGAQAHDFYSRERLDQNSIIVLEGDAAMQFVTRNYLYALRHQVSDPESLEEFACQYDDERNAELLNGNCVELKLGSTNEQGLTRA